MIILFLPWTSASCNTNFSTLLKHLYPRVLQISVYHPFWDHCNKNIWNIFFSIFLFTIKLKISLAGAKWFTCQSAKESPLNISVFAVSFQIGFLGRRCGSCWNMFPKHPTILIRYFESTDVSARYKSGCHSEKIPGLLMYLYCSVVMRKWNWTRSNHVQAFHLIGNHVNTSQVTGMPKKLTIISHNSIKIYAITNLLLFPNKKILSSLEGVKI